MLIAYGSLRVKKPIKKSCSKNSMVKKIFAETKMHGFGHLFPSKISTCTGLKEPNT